MYSHAVVLIFLAHKVIIPYCTGAPTEIDLTEESCDSAQQSPSAAAGAYIQRSKLWVQKELRVHFLNPDNIQYWRCGGDAMTTTTIMAWAVGAWNSPFYANIPKFVVTDSARKADIRVQFTGALA